MQTPLKDYHKSQKKPWNLQYLVFAIIGGSISLWIIYSLVFSSSHSSFGSLFSSNTYLRSDETPLYHHFKLGKSPAPLGSVRIELTEKQKTETYFGGKGDKEHLGGWAEFDRNGVSNQTWDYMMGILGVQSFLDIGCGRGYSTNYFHSKGARVLCLEGSHDAVLHSLLPSPDLIVEHDFTRGPYWPEETFDACWSVEFLEHVSRHYIKNYMNAFRKCALIFITASAWGGYHHVEVHPQYWWITKFTGAGFDHVVELQAAVRQTAVNDAPNLMEFYNTTYADERVAYAAQHIIHNMMVFVNPAVLSLPQHDHVLAGEGCYRDYDSNLDGGVPCTGVDALPEQYNGLLRCYKDQEKMKKLGIDARSMYWTCKKNPNYKVK